MCDLQQRSGRTDDLWPGTCGLRIALFWWRSGYAKTRRRYISTNSKSESGEFRGRGKKLGFFIIIITMAVVYCGSSAVWSPACRLGTPSLLFVSLCMKEAFCCPAANQGRNRRVLSVRGCQTVVQTYRTAAKEEKQEVSRGMQQQQEVSWGMQQQQEAFRGGVMILTRRSLVSLMGAAMALTAAASSVIAASIPLMVEPDLPRFRKTPSGVKIQEVVEGSGLEANNGDLVEFNYVCRRSNGYFVYSTVDQFGGESQPVVLPLGEGKIISGLEEVIVGMKPGGKRRALVPPAVGYVDLSLGPQPQEFGPRRSLISHANEPLVFEVQLLKIKSCSAGDSSKQLC